MTAAVRSALATGFCAAALFAAAAVPAGATVIYTLQPDLIVNGNNPTPPVADQNALNATSPLFPLGLDIIGKWDGGFQSSFDAGLTVSVDRVGDVFTWSLSNDLPLDWNVVMIGVKQALTTGYFLVDVQNGGADAGSFSMADLYALGDTDGLPATANLLNGWLTGGHAAVPAQPAVYFQNGNHNSVRCTAGNTLPACLRTPATAAVPADLGNLSGDLSHITFFGSTVPLSQPDDVTTASLPEPGAFALLGMGLVGFGAMTRRRRNA